MMHGSIEQTGRGAPVARHGSSAEADAAQTAFSAESRRPTQMTFAQFADRLRQDRVVWRSTIGDDLFVDPAWDMLLDLFVTRAQGKKTSVSALCLASFVPNSTALRWIVTMEKRGLVVRRADPCDRRRFFVQLTATALVALHEGLGRAAANWGIVLNDSSGMIGLPARANGEPRRSAG